MLWQIGEDLGFQAPVGREGEKAPRTSEEEGLEFARFAINVLDRLAMYHPAKEKAHWSEALLIRKYRFFLKNAGPWLYFGHELEARASRATSLDHLKETVNDFFFGPHATVQPMSERTDLRY